MMSRTCKSKFIIVQLSFLPIALLTLTLPAHAQNPFSSLPSGEPFSNRPGGAGEIVGTVYLNRGAEPASQVFVNIRSVSTGRLQLVQTDFGGHFDVRGIPPGTYEVSVGERGQGFTSTVTEVSFFPEEVTLYLNPGSAPPVAENPYTVSVRELKIPSKAQNEFERGLDRMAKQDFAGSLKHFNKAATDYPNYYEAIYHAGLAELRLNQLDKAGEDFQKAIDLTGGHYPRAQFAYGLLLCNQGKPKEAERVIRLGLETDSTAPEGHLFLGIALLNQSRLDEAEKSLREALLRRPQYPDVYLVLADVHAKREDYRSQIQDLDTYLKLAPSARSNNYIHRVREAAQRLADETPPQH